MHEAAVIRLYRGNCGCTSSIMLADSVVGSWELLSHLERWLLMDYLPNQLCM
jgi:hypothetical protein